MSADSRMFDIQTRHQIYVEGYKLFLAYQFVKIAEELANDLRMKLGALDVESLDQMPPRAFGALLRDVRASQTAIYSKWSEIIERESEAFMSADLRMQKTLCDLLLEEQLAPDDDPPELPTEARNVALPQPPEENGLPLVPFAWIAGTAAGLGALWAYITKQYIPANGLQPLVFLSSFQNGAIATTLQTITQAQANRMTPQALVKLLVGNKSVNYADGKLATLSGQSRAVTDTLIQHVSGIVSASVYSQYYRYYEWISVIDSGTTDICRKRNHHIYEYRKGPLPPAHGRCRSKTTPVRSKLGAALAPTYYSWLKAQPPVVIVAIIGKVQGAKLADGELTSKDLGNFVASKPISLDQFLETINVISTR